MATITGFLDVPDVAASQSAVWQKVRPIPLGLILVVQAVLSARLIPMGIASPDESLYIYSGHQLIHELWQGGGTPYYETYFSGSPVIYPVLAAMADHVGGLVAVRLMSLLFMLGATALLFASSRELFGYWSGIAAAGLFAGLGLTQDLGAYATYDAMALALVAAAAYCAIRTSDHDRQASRWLLLIPLALLAANATKYMTVIFDPVIIGLAALRLAESGWKGVWKRLMVLSAATALLVGLTAYLAGTAYIKGIMLTTLARKPGTQAALGAVTTPTHLIVAESWNWVGAVLLLGVVATMGALLFQRNKNRAALLSVLVMAGLLVTLEALRLHTNQSMRKHDDFGAWFTCIAASYMLLYVRALVKGRRGQYAVLIVATAAVLIPGVYYTPRSPQTYEGVRNSPYLMAFSELRPYIDRPGRYLLGGIADDELLYTDHLNVPWYSYVDDIYVKYPIPGRGGDSHGQTRGLACVTLKPQCMYLEGIAGYRAAIHAHWFPLISLVGDHGTAQYTTIEQIVEHTSGYVLLTRLGGEPTWIYAPAYR
jgi:Dolichyl-phosphate-mannose-protein mannosyltransferase